MKKLISVLLISSLVCTAIAAQIPVNAQKYLPVLQQVILEEWSNFKHPVIIASQIEQESCISLKHKGCWNPTTELKTKFEYGFGLGQLTIAYDKNGAVRFDNFQIMKKQFPQLKNWKWENRFDPNYQLRTMVLMDKDIYNKIKWTTASEEDRVAFMLASYNGGLGGIMKDRTICVNTKGCDPSKWFNNVELYSFKSRIKRPGYGEAAYDINRGYVKLVMFTRREKYVPYFKKEP